MPPLFELADDRVDFVPGQHEVAHHHGMFAGLLEGEPGAERKGRLYLHAVGGDLEIPARQADLVDVARLHGAGDAERLFNLLPVSLVGECWARDTDRENREGQVDSFAHCSPPCLGRVEMRRHRDLRTSDGSHI
jgi:hypothetical protein